MSKEYQNGAYRWSEAYGVRRASGDLAARGLASRDFAPKDLASRDIPPQTMYPGLHRNAGKSAAANGAGEIA